MDNIQQIADAVQKGPSITNWSGELPPRYDQANSLAQRAV